MKNFLIVLILFFASAGAWAQQRGIFDEVKGRVGNISSQAGNGRKDSISFVHRDDRKDSISITYKYIDSVRSIPMDSTINDFDKYFSLPSGYQAMGNNGAAAYSFVYKPFAKPGWDAGFHVFDVYRFTLEDTKFYKTNKPYSQLSYQLASGKEQMIKAFHTQNPRPNWNFGFDYRLISAPGFFVSQNTNHKSYRIFSNYQGKRKRYALYFVMLGNTLKNSENGGIKYDSSLSNPDLKKRYSVNTNLGNENSSEATPFNTSVNTGNVYKDFSFFLRQSYDVGKKDSIAINDSITEYLFYPKLRLQHSFTFSTYSYNFIDNIDPALIPNYQVAAKLDSAYFRKYYDTAITAAAGTLLNVKEKWSVIRNDFSLLQFPDTRNSAQFLLLGVTLENIQGVLKNGTKNLYNSILHAEYRNKTRNKQWDLVAKGELFLNGFNHGDYSAYATIGRYFNRKFGAVRLFFNNVNRSPSFIYDNASSFNFGNSSLTKKENIISFGAETNNPLINIAFRNHIITNLAYFSDYYHTAQSSKVINLIQVSASKKIKLSKRIFWYADATVQEVDGSAPVKVPLLFTRNRVAFEGTFYKNLRVSTGVEIRYYTPYKAYNYSPVMGQFAPQDSFKLKNLPDITAFFHFRIKAFTAFVRADNLNTISFTNGFSFTHNNYAAPHYPTEGLIIRFGIQWGFVN